MWSWFGTICFHLMQFCDSVSDNCIFHLLWILNWGLNAPLPAQLLQTNEQQVRIQGWKTKIRENNNQWTLLHIFSRTCNGQCQVETLFVYTIVPLGTPHLELTSENVSSKYWVVPSSLITSFILHPQLILLTNENPQLPVCILYPLDW